MTRGTADRAGKKADKRAKAPRGARLGRGLSALLGDDGAALAALAGPEAAAAPAGADGGLRVVPIHRVSPHPDQPRRHFDGAALAELAASLKRQGVVQPLLVRPHPMEPDQWQIIAGERRWRAAQRAGLHAVPVVARDLDDSAALEAALVENIHREELSPLEEAAGYRRLMDDFGHTQASLARVVGKSRSHVANALRLLSLPASARAMLAEGRLSAGHGRALLAARDPEALARQVAARGASVREAESLARASHGGGAGKGGAKAAGQGARRVAAPENADIAALEARVSAALGARVAVRLDAPGGERGRLEARFSSLEQLDMILGRLTRAD